MDQRLYPEPDANVDFDAAEKVHDWRNHVGKRTRALWPALTSIVREAIAQDAQVAADNEHWD